MNKVCGKHGESLDALMFYTNKASKDGLMWLCKECAKQATNTPKFKTWAKKYRLKNSIRLSATTFNYKLKSQYGLSRDQYELMIKNQNNRCIICGNPFTTPKHTHIDHDHKTGSVRGVLCSNCNTGIGFFRENIDIMISAIKYLDLHQ